MAVSSYLKAALNEQMFNAGSAYVPPGTFYLAIWVDDPTPDASGSAEASGGGYARLPIGWELITDDYFNDGDITFDLDTGSYAYGAVFDDVSAGNMLFYGIFNTPITMVAPGTQLIPQDAIRAVLV